MSFPLCIWMEDVPPNVLHFVFKDLPVEYIFPRLGGFSKKKKKKKKELTECAYIDIIIVILENINSKFFFFLFSFLRK